MIKMDKNQKRAKVLDEADWVGKDRHEDTKVIRNLLVDLIIEQKETNKLLARIDRHLNKLEQGR